ncbi:hypothetical protein [Cellulomonas terrae]|nr:hypothetical protein [Cellulomonas terrae]
MEHDQRQAQVHADGALLDLHARAVEAASEVLAQYWPEGTAPLDLDLLAARMGIEVVLGRPEGDAAVAAVRDEHGARVVLAASLHPSVRSALLIRAIGHLTRPGTPLASDGVGDEFTKSFASALRIPEIVLDSLRRQGVPWPEIDHRLGVARNAAQDQQRLYWALWRRRHQASFDAQVHALEASTGTRRRLPQDELTGTLRGLEREVRTRLWGVATFSEPPTVGGSGLVGGDPLGADRDGVLVTPTAIGAVPFWWSQTADEISLGVGDSARWVAARDDRGVAVVRQLVDAVVFGRVEVGRGAHGSTCRVQLADGTVLDAPSGQPAPDRSDALVWTWAAAYVERGDLLQQVANAMARFIDRAGRGEPWSRAVQVDAELSDAIVAYVGMISDRPEVLADHAVRRSPSELQATIHALRSELWRVPVEARGITIWEECRLVHDVFAPRHPELSEQALNALMMRYAWANR